MHKLPVYATAAKAYRFLLHDVGTILRLSWLPLLVVTVIQYFAARAHFAAMRSALEAGDITAMRGVSPVWQWQILSAIATILGTAVVAVALHRVILLGDRKPGSYVHVAFGKVEMLFALLPIIVLLPVLLWSVVVLALIGVAAPMGGGALWAMVFLVGLVFWAGLIFAFVRLGTIFPVTVIEGRYDFGQAWALTRGNFWRIVGLWIVAIVPFFVVVIVVTAVTTPFGDLEMGKGTPKQMIALFDWIESRFLVQTVISYVWSIIGGALGVAVLSYSYKALSGVDPDAVWTTES